MRFEEAERLILANTWHKQSASSSLERWFEVCEKEQWGNIPENIHALIMLFGASWYFTRFMFYRGKAAADLVDRAANEKFTLEHIAERFIDAEKPGEPEQQLEALRCLKNEIMLQIAINYLSGSLSQQKTELALTLLADATLNSAMSIFGLHQVPRCRVAALGMGRMAGYEMIFGSDLDLIFLFDSDREESIIELSRKIRMLLRHLSSVSSSGSLYEVDMRLRPHGTSGALLTSTRSFLEYHQGAREIWERQMMTRCRAVSDYAQLGQETLNRIRSHIYAEYDREYLRNEVTSMRQRVFAEKGRPRGKYDIKRGRGGIMDIDFISHYLQLAYGYRHKQLETGSTRQALTTLAEIGILEQGISAELLDAYDFLKQMESCVRLFDMKPVSTISGDHMANAAIATAMGFADDTEAFMDSYFSVTGKVSSEYNRILGEA